MKEKGLSLRDKVALASKIAEAITNNKQIILKSNIKPTKEPSAQEKELRKTQISLSEQEYELFNQHKQEIFASINSGQSDIDIFFESSLILCDKKPSNLQKEAFTKKLKSLCKDRQQASKFTRDLIKSDVKDPFARLFDFEIPTSNSWNREKWYNLCVRDRHYLRLLEYAPDIEKALGHTPQSYEEAYLTAAHFIYPTSKQLDSIKDSDLAPHITKATLKEFIRLCVERGNNIEGTHNDPITESAFATGWKILTDPNLKQNDYLPKVKIKGEDIAPQFSKFTFNNTPAGDPRGLLPGKFTHDCQSIGGVGESCVITAMTSERSGSYFICDTSGKKDKVIAQIWANIIEQNGKKILLLDSFQRLGPEHDKLFEPFMEQFVAMVRSNHPEIDQINIGFDKTSHTPKQALFEAEDNNIIPNLEYTDAQYNQYVLYDKNRNIGLDYKWKRLFEEIASTTVASTELISQIENISQGAKLAGYKWAINSSHSEIIRGLINSIPIEKIENDLDQIKSTLLKQDNTLLLETCLTNFTDIFDSDIANELFTEAINKSAHNLLKYMLSEQYDLIWQSSAISLFDYLLANKNYSFMQDCANSEDCITDLIIYSIEKGQNSDTVKEIYHSYKDRLNSTQKADILANINNKKHMVLAKIIINDTTIEEEKLSKIFIENVKEKNTFTTSMFLASGKIDQKSIKEALQWASLEEDFTNFSFIYDKSDISLSELYSIYKNDKVSEPCKEYILSSGKTLDIIMNNVTKVYDSEQCYNLDMSSDKAILYFSNEKHAQAALSILSNSNDFVRECNLKKSTIAGQFVIECKDLEQEFADKVYNFSPSSNLEQNHTRYV